MATRRRVLVVGAGPSGLVATKECREEGAEVVCLEAMPYIGGLWKFTENETHSSVYRTTVINTCKEMMNFSDFLIPEDFPPFLSHAQCIEYFEMYVDHFKLRDYIRLRTRVESVRPAPDYAATGRYVVRYWEEGQPEQEETFDAVLACTGHHSKPKTPSFKGLERFRGRTLHSHAYKDHVGFEGKTVVVVGAGNSALDVAVELSRFTRQTYLSTRSGTWLFTRVGARGLPHDYAAFTREARERVTDDRVEAFLNRSVDLKMYGLQPKHRVGQAHPSVNGDLIGRINTGTLLVRPNIHEFKEASIVYEDGVELPCDAVVFATGYEIAFPYLDPACGVTVVKNEVTLYKYVFPPDLPHPTLAIVGLVQPLGSLMPIAEMQCRWISRVLSGKLKLPNAKTMHADIQRKKDEMRKRYITSERHTIQVDYITYCDEIAEFLGCKPDFWTLFWQDPELANAVWSKGAVPSQYRLLGPKAWPGARDAVLGAEDRLRKSVGPRRFEGQARPRL